MFLGPVAGVFPTHANIQGELIGGPERVVDVGSGIVLLAIRSVGVGFVSGISQTQKVRCVGVAGAAGG